MLGSRGEGEAPDDRPVVAVATAWGPAAIGILRINGPGALALCRRRLVGLPAAPVARQMQRARLLDASGQPLDDVLVVPFLAPRSYTGDELVEIHCHGGTALQEAALASLLSAGGRLAEPGEFTRRAVHNGRVDLVDAEALAAILEAEDQDGLTRARAARETGPLLRALRERAKAALAEALGALDHPMETVGEVLRWPEECRALEGEVRRLRGDGTLERRELEGSRVILLGPPNAGKSSLFNALLGEPRALVDSEPGTTRDVVTAPMRLGGRRVTLCDCAGLRSAAGLEGAGVRRALDFARAADLVLWTADVSAPAARPPDDLEVDLWVATKGDLPSHPEPRSREDVRVSVREGWGLDVLRMRIESALQRPFTCVSRRQAALLEEAAHLLQDARTESATEDLRVRALERAAEVLDRLCGQGPSAAEVEDEVFRRFCVGK